MCVAYIFEVYLEHCMHGFPHFLNFVEISLFAANSFFITYGFFFRGEGQDGAMIMRHTSEKHFMDSKRNRSPFSKLVIVTVHHYV